MGKTVLVTGASRGIGEAIAIEFAKNGYNVALNYNRSDEKAKALALVLESFGAKVLLVKANVANLCEVEGMFQKILAEFGSLDVLVNNAGVSQNALLIDQSEEEIKKVIDINLMGTIYCSKEALKIMMSNMQGKIVNISSMWGDRGASMEAVYSASKAGVIGLTKALAKEAANMRVNVNAICPGVIDTDMCKVLSEETRNMLLEANPFGRLGTGEDIAKLAYFLASEDASFITGQVITVDGGVRM